MKRKPVWIILVITISLAISVSSAYVCYYTVASADFISHNPKLESFDQEFLSVSNQNESKVFDSGSLFKGTPLVTYPVGVPSQLFSKIPSVDQKTLALRC